MVLSVIFVQSFIGPRRHAYEQNEARSQRQAGRRIPPPDMPTHTRTDGRTTRKHNVSGPIYLIRRHKTPESLRHRANCECIVVGYTFHLLLALNEFWFIDLTGGDVDYKHRTLDTIMSVAVVSYRMTRSLTYKAR